MREEGLRGGLGIWEVPHFLWSNRLWGTPFNSTQEPRVIEHQLHKDIREPFRIVWAQILAFFQGSIPFGVVKKTFGVNLPLR